jgi:hypothetical protein
LRSSLLSTRQPVIAHSIRKLIWLISQIQRKDQRSAAQKAGSEVTYR